MKLAEATTGHDWIVFIQSSHTLYLLIDLTSRPHFHTLLHPPSTSYAPSPLMQPTFLQLNLVISDYQLAFASPSLHIYICTLLQLACFHISTLAFFRSILICCMFTFLSSDMCCNQSVGIDKLVYSKSVDASSSGTYDTEWFGGGNCKTKYKKLMSPSMKKKKEN